MISLPPLPPHLAAAHAFILSTPELPAQHMALRVGGSHAYRTAGPNSDVNLLGVFVAPTRSLLGMSPLEPKLNIERVVNDITVRYDGIELGTALAQLAKGNTPSLEHLHGGRRGVELLIKGSSELVDIHKLVTTLMSKNLLMKMEYEAMQTCEVFRDEVFALRHKPNGGHLCSRRFLHSVRLALTIADFIEDNECITLPLPMLLKGQRAHLRAETIAGIEKVVEEKREGRDHIPAELVESAITWVVEVVALAESRLAKCQLPKTPSKHAVDHVNEKLIDYRLRWART